MPSDEQAWMRTAEGKIVLRLIEGWEAGVTQHGDIALSFTSSQGNDPKLADEARHRAQFICTREDAKHIAHMILRALAFAENDRRTDFAGFRAKIRAPALRALADQWDKARGTRRMPAFTDLQTDRIAQHLGHVWGFDYDREKDSFTGRLAGSVIMHSFGKSFLGTPLIELHPPPAFEAAEAALMRTISMPACSRWTGGLYKVGNHVIEGERVVFPMGTDPEHPDGVLGACWFETTLQLLPGEPVELLHDSVEWFEI
jgi:hypothetical protein